MKKRKPSYEFEILPYEEVFSFEVKLFIVDINTYTKNINKWLNDRTENIDNNSDAEMKLNISSEGFNLAFYPSQDDNCLFSMRINHVVALQIKQACEYYIDCYEKHGLQNDIALYKDIDSIHTK